MSGNTPRPSAVDAVSAPVASASAPLSVRCTLRFVDIDPETYTMSAEAAEAARLAADEAVRKAEDPLAVAAAGAADLIVVKVQPLGGVRRAAAIVAAAGLPAVVSSALDTSVGIAGGAALAACLPSLPHACGLGTAALFEHDVVAPAWRPRAGALPAPGERAPAPDPELLDRLRADGTRQAWWADRVRAAHAVLAAQG